MTTGCQVHRGSRARATEEILIFKDTIIHPSTMTTIWWSMCYNYTRRQVIMVLSPCCLPRSTFHPLHNRFLQFPLKQIWCILGQKLFYTFMHRAWNTRLRSQLCDLDINRMGLTLPCHHLCLPSNSQLWPLFHMGILQLPPGNAIEISNHSFVYCSVSS